VRAKLPHPHPTALDDAPAPAARACAECGRPVPAGSRAAYCSDRCRVRARHRGPYAEVHRARQLARYRARAAAGVCARQGCDSAPEPGRRMCRPCLDALNARTREAKRRTRAEAKTCGRCRDCPKPAPPGKSRCAACRERNNARNPPDPEKAREWRRRTRRARRDAGLCPHCAQPAAPGRTLCPRHLEAARLRAARY
jgi:hypothetical protein